MAVDTPRYASRPRRQAAPPLPRSPPAWQRARLTQPQTQPQTQPRGAALRPDRPCPRPCLSPPCTASYSLSSTLPPRLAASPRRAHGRASARLSHRPPLSSATPPHIHPPLLVDDPASPHGAHPPLPSHLSLPAYAQPTPSLRSAYAQPTLSLPSLPRSLLASLLPCLAPLVALAHRRWRRPLRQPPPTPQLPPPLRQCPLRRIAPPELQLQRLS